MSRTRRGLSWSHSCRWWTLKDWPKRRGRVLGRSEISETNSRMSMWSDDSDELVGQLSMVNLALADNAATIRTIASPFLAKVTVDTPAEECARLQRHYNLTQLPVVDGDRLIGRYPGGVAAKRHRRAGHSSDAAGGQCGRRDGGRTP